MGLLVYALLPVVASLVLILLLVLRNGVACGDARLLLGLGMVCDGDGGGGGRNTTAVVDGRVAIGEEEHRILEEHGHGRGRGRDC